MFHGQTVYGELTQVPFIARWPAGIAKGRTVDEVVQTIDVMPTLLEMSGIEPPPGHSGTELCVAAARPGCEWSEGVDEPAGHHGKAADRRTDGAAPPPHDTESVRHRRRRLETDPQQERPRGGPEFELYDFHQGPAEQDRRRLRSTRTSWRGSPRPLDGWKKMAEAARLKPDAEAAKTLSPEQLQRLRSLGYVR